MSSINYSQMYVTPTVDNLHHFYMVGFAGAVGYFTFSSISRDGMAILITVVAIVAIASYLLAAHVHANKMRNIL